MAKNSHPAGGFSAQPERRLHWGSSCQKQAFKALPRPQTCLWISQTVHLSHLLLPWVLWGSSLNGPTGKCVALSANIWATSELDSEVKVPCISSIILRLDTFSMDKAAILSVRTLNKHLYKQRPKIQDGLISNMTRPLLHSMDKMNCFIRTGS